MEQNRDYTRFLPILNSTGGSIAKKIEHEMETRFRVEGLAENQMEILN